MELKLNNAQFPETISFNFEELKKEITDKAELYKGMVYTDDTIKEAKADKAKLNKFVTVLEDKRKEVKKQCLEPYEAFERQMKELVAIIKEPVMLIDSQVKDFEEREKAEKLDKVKEIFQEVGFQPFVNLQMIMDNKWLNKSVSLKSIKSTMEERRNAIGHDVATINSLEAFSFEAMETYKRTLDLSKAISEGQRLADIQKRKLAHEEKLKAEAEARKLKEVKEVEKTEVENIKPEQEDVAEVEQERRWLSFKTYLSIAEAKKLGNFCKENNLCIEPLSVEEMKTLVNSQEAK